MQPAECKLRPLARGAGPAPVHCHLDLGSFSGRPLPHWVFLVRRAKEARTAGPKAKFSKNLVLKCKMFSADLAAAASAPDVVEEVSSSHFKCNLLPVAWHSWPPLNSLLASSADEQGLRRGLPNRSRPPHLPPFPHLVHSDILPHSDRIRGSGETGRACLQQVARSVGAAMSAPGQLGAGPSGTTRRPSSKFGTINPNLALNAGLSWFLGRPGPSRDPRAAALVAFPTCTKGLASKEDQDPPVHLLQALCYREHEPGKAHSEAQPAAAVPDGERAGSARGTRPAMMTCTTPPICEKSPAVSPSCCVYARPQ